MNGVANWVDVAESTLPAVDAAVAGTAGDGPGAEGVVDSEGGTWLVIASGVFVLRGCMRHNIGRVIVLGRLGPATLVRAVREAS